MLPRYSAIDVEIVPWTTRPAHCPSLGDHTMRGRIWALLIDDAGAEVVEWVLWLGGIVIVCAALFATISGGLPVAVARIFD